MPGSTIGISLKFVPDCETCGAFVPKASDLLHQTSATYSNCERFETSCPKREEKTKK
jgi:hypothetical protein